ncbi:YhcN/YlaJ family sporulation lipoprotein [Pseudalkalibacillus decolorationis]|uniref:YhcN/YlaJ family sporulation lipoprotein n=1 Tax=Pseudalkalibacillus decolorationis TaxID=163879 RepID=UPI002147CB9A|nr:YhcN/YlaJ family sporulation lipoprotein [Pseudalkalibacillus decolorationis]
MNFKWIKEAKLLLVASAFAIPLVGCNANDDNNQNAEENGVETQDIGNENINEDNNGMVNDDDGNNGNGNNANNGANGNNRYEVADKAANKVEALPEVGDATVLVTDENAYVAAQLQNNKEGEVTQEMEKKISDQVKSVDPDVNNVYVSTNPDFLDRVNNYVSKVDEGKPVEGLGEEIGEAIRRVFPNQR